jgi:quinol monooxygenase YgiN
VTYGLFGGFQAAPGARDQLVAVLLDAARLLQRDARCRQYLVGTSEDPDAVWVCELWTDRAAHDASLEPEDVRALIALARPLIVGMLPRTEFSVAGGTGP